ncbi:MAG: hypothetical protein SGI92_03260 [Bryobacteraceae bacterium]|nr:hypothetical protein [Bryobacteraceae bacterium]
MEITDYLSPSAMQLQDMNNDCAISDVDVAMMLDDQLVALYGAQFEMLGDVDADGVVTGEDIIAAVGKLIKAAYGKTTPNAQPVGTPDVLATLDAVLAQSPEGDINLDGSKDIVDVSATATQVGNDFIPSEVDQIARKAFAYIGAIREFGRARFMATACAPLNHLRGVSGTWPNPHPNWWQPNHLTGVSSSYNPPADHATPDHSTFFTEREPWPAHEEHVSRSWPANHLWESSRTWTPPAPHDVVWSALGHNRPHGVGLSSHWPSGHTASASTTWPADHDLNTSRGWWPHHLAADSGQRVAPPMHVQSISQNWSHQAAASQMVWPPNHYASVSGGWGLSHAPGVSGSWPPAHLNYASNGWPGPQPTWPPTHTAAVSASWGDPAPGGWPIFPPDHTWWTTFQDIPGIVPQFPWPP